MSRAVDEWIGATEDSQIPDRVKLRIWQREGGRCYLSGRKIMPGDAYDFEHVKALWKALPGERLNCESNIRLALRDKHKVKSAADRAEKAKTDSMAKKHAGIRQKSSLTHPTLKRTMDGRVVTR
jgi:5-methylcytosine-specific restriction protein A